MLQNRNSKRLHWANLIEKWQQSGMKAQTWCRENQVVYTTFLGWRNRLKGHPQSKEICKLSVKAQFIELKEAPKVNPEISLEYDGILIHLKADFDPFLLKKCLGVLRGAPC